MEKSMKDKRSFVNVVTPCILLIIVLSHFSCEYKTVLELLSSSSAATTIEDKLPVHGNNLNNVTEDTYHSNRCLSADRDLESLLNKTGQIFALSAPKAGGTSMASFRNRCHGKAFKEGFMGMMVKENRRIVVTGSPIPKVLSFHIREDDKLIPLLRSATDETLIFYSYRSETERLVSAIKHVVKTRYCIVRIRQQKYLQNGIRTEEECVVHESNLNKMIEDRIGEVHGGNHNLFTCDIFNALEENKPNFVIYDMKRLEKVQLALAKKYCPKLEGQNFHKNDGSTRRNDVMVRFGDQSGENRTQPDMLLEDWIEEKKHLLEWSLDLYNGGSCRGKLRALENELSSCVQDGGVGIVVSSVPKLMIEETLIQNTVP